MNALRNKAQLIGNVGADPEVKSLEGDRKFVRLSLATNESWKNEAGDKVTDTQWHVVTAWGKTAEIIEKYVKKGSEIAVEGRLVHRSYEDKNGDKRYCSEVQIAEILLLGKN